jgi:hypothetical protein
MKNEILTKKEIIDNRLNQANCNVSDRIKSWRNMIESLFNMIHPVGIKGFSSPQKINEIFVLTEKLLTA